MSQAINFSKSTQMIGLLASISVCVAIGWIGAQVSPGMANAEWYNELNKPWWNPPGWIFGPVWSALYISMATAAWLIWKRGGFKKNTPELGAYILQLFLNGLWSQLFFGLQEIFWAFIEIIILLGAIGATTTLFFNKSRIAGWLMVPYMAWVLFATFLNGVIWWING